MAHNVPLKFSKCKVNQYELNYKETAKKIVFKRVYNIYFSYANCVCYMFMLIFFVTNYVTHIKSIN